ncbi:dihydrofolate reductase family protein [uncultured Williamsia sp.]|uniref:dihydrofolate reductase family protein n=1 Tax=uncultured Williamsia sp. TaxID=259311 RepID=UPI0026145E85|nr:dihydrofolate reductase family protein [uncultured Williamsia sp.]
MTAEYTVDLFTTLDGFAAPKAGTWGGYWGKESDAWLEHRRRQFHVDQHMVFGADTYRLFRHFQDIGIEPDPWVARMLGSPMTVVSSTLQPPLDWPDATVASGDAIEVVRRLKTETDLPLRSHGSVSLNRALMAAGVVDRLLLTVFPVITGTNGDDPIHRDGPDFDLELISSTSFDGGIVELAYRPTLHT